jgi:hypothetical protein
MAENIYGDPQGAEQALFRKKKYFIELRHLPSGEDVKFKAMLTQFEDQYSSEWNTEQIFGRMDPIKGFRGTQRIITLGWDVVAGSIEEARHNLRECSTLLSMLYPSYDGPSQHAAETPAPPPTGLDQQSAQAGVTNSNSEKASNFGSTTRITGAPLFRLKFANLIQSAASPASANTDIESGLVGAIDGLTYAPDVEQGFFDPEPGVLYPQTIRLSFGFSVVHEHALGWQANREKAPRAPAGKFYPYPKTTGED